MVVNGVVSIGAINHRLYVLSTTTGNPQWSYETDGGLYSSPMVVNGTVFVGSVDMNLYVLEAGTGRKRWLYQTGSTVSSPTVADCARSKLPGCVVVSRFLPSNVGGF